MSTTAAKGLALSLLLRPSNIAEAAKPLCRALNRVTDWHHRALDYLIPTLTNNSILFPHGAKPTTPLQPPLFVSPPWFSMAGFFNQGFGDYEIAKRFYEEVLP